MLAKDLPKCPVETSLMMLNSRWKFLILRELLTGTKRFANLKRLLVRLLRKFLPQICAKWKILVLLKEKFSGSSPAG